MLIFPLTVFLVLVSFSEQHEDRKSHYDENGNYIGHGKGTPHGQHLNPRQHEPEYDEGSYERTESEIEKPCRRAMPQDSGYQPAFVSPSPPLQRKSLTPKSSDLVRKPVSRIQSSQNLPENVPGEVPQIREKSGDQDTETDLRTKTLEPIRPVLRQGKPLLTHEQIKNDDDRDDVESNKEAANHIIKHNEAIPSHTDHAHPYHVLNSEKLHDPHKDISKSGLDKHHTKELISSQVKEYNTKQRIILQDKSLRQGDHDFGHNVDTGDSTPIQKEFNDEIIHSRSGKPNVVDLKSQIQTDNKSPTLSNNCKIEDRTDESDDSLSQSRRSMSQGNKQDGKLATTSRAPSKPEQQGLLESEDKNDRQGYSPGLQYIIPTRKPIVIPSGKTLLEPTRGLAITPLKESPLAAMDSSRICYACSTLSDPSCWFPNKGTTVKYCRRGHNACVTKTLINNGVDLIVVRDCSDSCGDITAPVLDTNHVSCSICRKDLCNDLLVEENGAFSINPFNAMCILILTGIAKYLF